MNIKISACLIILIGSLAGCAHAEVNNDQAVRAIIGEASSEGYEGMYAVACAIRNRQTLKGVYGLKAKHVNAEPGWVWQLASKAWWEAEAGKDVTNGATSWENIEAFGEPYWAKQMEVTYKLGRHTFYREKNKIDSRKKSSH